MPSITILIPVYNEAASLRQLFDEISQLQNGHQTPVEVIFIDDGSTDESWDIIRELGQVSSNVKGIRFRKNFGKAAALQAGIDAASGDFLVTMDADLQDDPAEIPRLLEKLEPDFDLVSGWKVNRQDPWGKRIASKIFNFIVSWSTGVKLRDHNCGLKMYRAEVFDQIKLYGEMHRFLPVLASAQGFRVGELPVNHRPRKHGQSKYGWERIGRGMLDLLTVSFLTSYNQRPQHLLGSVGGLIFLAGLAGTAWTFIYWLLRVFWFHDWTPLHQRPLLLYSIGSLLLGAQFLSLGFLAELIVAKGQAVNCPYNVRERINSDD